MTHGALPAARAKNMGLRPSGPHGAPNYLLRTQRRAAPRRSAPVPSGRSEEAAMRRTAGTIKRMLAVAVIAATSATLALAGYVTFGGYDRGGYEVSASFGHVPIGGYDRGGYEYSALAGHLPIGGHERGGSEV